MMQNITRVLVILFIKNILVYRYRITGYLFLVGIRDNNNKI